MYNGTPSSRNASAEPRIRNPNANLFCVAKMNIIIKRTLAAILCGYFLCASVPAQDPLGPYRFSSLPAPSLQRRTHISVGPIRWGDVIEVGGVAFDSKASPADGITVNNVSLNYLPAERDGERLSVTIYSRRVVGPIYDWQLIPIAKFADSEFDSCFTLFGHLQDKAKEDAVTQRGGHILNYHESFQNTLMGLRLFQLDNLIINPYSWDLVKFGGVYALGAGESAPNVRENHQAQILFETLNPELDNTETMTFDSYIISDRRRHAVFDIQGSTLTIQGEPSYTFVRRTVPSEATMDQAAIEVEREIRAQLGQRDQIDGIAWLTEQVIAEAEKYDETVGDVDSIESSLRQLLSIHDRAGRRAVLTRATAQSLFDQLIDLRVLVRTLKAWEVPGLSEKISNQTPALRAINPAVWDAGVVLLRYAAFFRYCKARNPAQWRVFMNQINEARAPRPLVTTPTVLEGLPTRPRQ
jgi:hypothetical protein